jgi:ribonuclease HII
MPPGFEYEQASYAQGYRYVVGIDEAGRGCWAGPVVAAAVMLPPAAAQQPDLLAQINDSKQLRPAQRDTSYALLRALTPHIGVGVVPPDLIDLLGIVPATRLAMTTALLALPGPVEALLIDALTLPGLSLPQQALIRGDACSYSIAAASIIAKVSRDRMMATAEAAYPGYGFGAHKGYGTAAHRRALNRLGPCPLHRHSYRPVQDFTPADTADATGPTEALWYTESSTTPETTQG